jgi:predicted Zn-dependent peptidase
MGKRVLAVCVAMAGLGAALVAAAQPPPRPAVPAQPAPSQSAPLAVAAPAAAAPAAAPSIPFEKYSLKNGLVVVLSEDRTIPMVTVGMMVKVGSRFEPPKRSGFAHLFEHLMFMGTERVPTGKFDAWMEAEGAWNNAWTSEDRTFYYAVGPAHVLPLLLWLEADRVSSLNASMTQEKLDAQRGVVKNERRQRIENKPYRKIELVLPRLMYAPGHPYHHPVIGSHEDLDAAQVDDVKKFFSDWYAANNMALFVVGDFDKAALQSEIERLFGGLPSAAVPAAPAASEPKLGGVVRETVPDDVLVPKVVMAWHSPAQYAPGDADLDILGNVLDRGKTSRLYKALVYDKELAQSVSATQASQELSSMFVVEAVAREGVTAAEIEKAIDAVMKSVLEGGVTAAEVDRAKIDYETSFVRQLESIHARASALATYETFRGNPGWMGADLERYRKVDAASVNAAAKRYLDLGARAIVTFVPAKKEGGKP